jgi:hypothetical protein
MFGTEKKYKYVDLEKMQEILDCFQDHPERVIFSEPEPHKPISPNCYIKETKTELQVTCCFKKTYHYMFKLDGSTRTDGTTGMIAYTTMAKYAKPQKCEDYGIDPEKLGSCAGILYKNDKFKGKRVPAYSYDINSAFSAQMLGPLPDLATARLNDVVGENEVGFVHKPNEALGGLKDVLVPIYTKGVECEYVFKLMESPYKRFVETWYDRKNKAKTKEAKTKAKMILNASIGYLQKTNPFWRSVIIHRCNRYVQSLIDENTIYSNTDCIVSAVRRPDIEEHLGTGLGEFKLEHSGHLFAWAQDTMIYQWDFEVPVARGVPKEWFKVKSEILGRPFDLLIDEIPFGLNRYTFDKDTLMILEANYENYNG